MDDDSANFLNMPSGLVRVWDGPKHIWTALFPIKFTSLNAALRKHFSLFSLRDTSFVTTDSSLGFITYKVSFNGFDIGSICLQELPDEQSTEFRIIPPLVESGWTQEQRMIINSQPDRDATIKIMYEMATQDAEKRKKILEWQGFVFNLFLRQFMNDPIIEEAILRPNLELYVDDIDSFAQVKRVSPQSVKENLPLDLLEEYIQTSLEEIIGESFHPLDGPHETSDLRTSQLMVKGRRIRAAFVLKGKGTKGKLTIKKCGKNGDQIVKLMDTPAELYIIQHIDDIDERVISDLRSKIDLKNRQGMKCQMCIINGTDTARILKAYSKI